MGRRKKIVGKFRGDIDGSGDIGLDSVFHKTPNITPNNEPFSQEMHLKIPLLSIGLKLSKLKSGCRVCSALHFLVK
jgi:hypothetical protein